MSFSNPSTLLVAGALASPTLWQAAVVGDVSIADAALRFLICVPVAAVMLAVLRMVTRDFGSRLTRRAGEHPGRRTGDAPAVTASPTPDA